MPNLVGIGNSQVPTNAMLGGLAYQDPAHANLTEVEIENISAIKAKISQSANRIFVYDTRKDSDGGAWRKRCSRKSWYNETLGTQQRGVRKEFPAIAVIVTYNNGVVIHDGDDPSLPMWMELWQYVNDSSGSTEWWGGSGDAGGVAAMNGEFAVTTGSSARTVNFIKDKISVWYSPVPGGNYQINHGIADRNKAYNNWYKADQDYRQLVANTPNEISVGVMSYAETDPHTGLPIPTYCITTPAGTTVVESTQAKTYDIVATSSGYGNQYRSVIKHGRLYLIADPRILYTFDLPLTQDRTGGSLAGYSGIHWLTALQSSGTAAETASLAVTNSGDIAIGTASELLLVKPNLGQSNILNEQYKKVASIGSVWNTGWQSGKSFLATLSTTVESDSIAPSYSGENLVVNGDFRDSAGWTIALNGASGGSPAVTVSSGTAVFQQGTSNSVWLYLYRNITTVVGQHYEVELRVDSTNTNANWRIQVNGVTVMGYGITNGGSSTSLGKGSHFADFTATGTSTSIQIQQGGGAGVAGTLGYIAVRRVLVKNGNFRYDAAGWTATNGATLSQEAGVLKMVGGTTDYPRASQDVGGLVVGKRYVFVGEGHASGHSYIITLSDAASANPTSGWKTSSAFRWTYYFVAASTNLVITLQGSANDNIVHYFNHISVKEVPVYDHSSVWRPLSVFGDIKTVPVAPGAELMAYTNFNGSKNVEHGNQLMQEYVDNAYMDFTGDFNISFWFDGSATGTGSALEMKWVDDNDDNGWMIHINSLTSYFLDGGWDAYSQYRQINSTNCYRDSWCKVNFVRRSNVLYYYLDGVLVDSGYSLSGGHWTMTKTERHKFHMYMARGSADAKFALLNMGGAITTDAEIWDMYREELPMFEPNSRVALVGTDTMYSSGVINSNIKAVAHDDSTDTLHVGTEHGRTDMNGLLVINNTTTAVTTDISASNGLIAEQ
tara:strand:+ start:1642 stop:4485 length:2844 start_codon:yes stop_codon:yes gene_type:complete